MYDGKRFLGVIPARGGSISVPRKNIHPLGGKPLLFYTIRQAVAVEELDLVLVSTDDAEIAAIARDLGVNVIDRPPDLATATAPTEWALLHALDTLTEQEPFDYVVVLEPTSPFRSPKTIQRCIHAIAKSGAPSLLTVRETRSNLGRLVDGRFRPLMPDAPRRRQDREPLYVESSTVYVCSTEHLRRTGTLVADDWVAIEVPARETLDINSAEDFAFAECFIRMGKVN